LCHSVRMTTAMGFVWTSLPPETIFVKTDCSEVDIHNIALRHVKEMHPHVGGDVVVDIVQPRGASRMPLKAVQLVLSGSYVSAHLENHPNGHVSPGIQLAFEKSAEELIAAESKVIAKKASKKPVGVDCAGCGELRKEVSILRKEILVQDEKFKALGKEIKAQDEKIKALGKEIKAQDEKIKALGKENLTLTAWMNRSKRESFRLHRRRLLDSVQEKLDKASFASAGLSVDACAMLSNFGRVRVDGRATCHDLPEKDILSESILTEPDFSTRNGLTDLFLFLFNETPSFDE